MRSHIEKRGLFIVLVGPDGCGKSTIAENLLRTPPPQFSNVFHFHWRPGWLPPLGRWRRDASNTETSDAPPTDFAYGYVGSFIRYLYYLIDFVAGYWIRIRPRLKQSQLVIGERGYLDLVVDPRRYGFRLPGWLLHLGGLAVPAADLVILLKADALRVHSRKPELSVKRLHELHGRLYALLPAPPVGVCISTDGTITSSAQMVRDAIVDAHELLTTTARPEAQTEWRRFPTFGRARVWVAHEESIDSALCLYHPYSFAGKLVKLIHRFPVRRLSLPIKADRNRRAHFARICRLMARELSSDKCSTSFYVGTPGPHRKLTVKVNAGEDTLAYAKIGQEACVDRLLERERATLLNLNEKGLLIGQAPSVLGHLESRRATFLLLAPPPCETVHRSLDFDDCDLDFLCMLARVNHGETDVEAYYRVACARNEVDFDAHIRSNSILLHAKETIRRILGHDKIKVCMSHGDYAPWNTLQLKGGEIFAFDWEYASPDSSGLFDFCHYHFTIERLINRSSPLDAVNRVHDLCVEPCMQRLLHQTRIPRAVVGAYILLYLTGLALREISTSGIRDYIASALHYCLVRHSHPMHRLRVLVSAYACEAGVGSEPGVGWNWAKQIASTHEVWVITRKNNRDNIEEALCEAMDGYLHAEYVDVPKWFAFWKRGQRGIRLYYYIWQFAALCKARGLHREIGFDIGHHVTFVNDWLWTFFALMPIPFVWGPIGSNPRPPFQLLSSPKARRMEFVRLLIQGTMRQIDPLYWLAAVRSSAILTINARTAALFPLRLLGKNKLRIEPAIGNDPIYEYSQRVPEGRFNVLYVGHFAAIKAPHLALLAFAKFAKETRNVRLTMIGAGSEEAHLRRLVSQHRLEAKVTLENWKPRSEVLALFKRFDTFLFPSLEGGGMVVLEAMAAGLPIVCLNYGGPGSFVTEKTGFLVEVDTTENVARGLAAALAQLHRNAALRRSLGQSAQTRVSQRFLWSCKRHLIDGLYRQILFGES